MKLEQILAFLRQLRRLPAVYYIGGSEILPPPLPPEEEAAERRLTACIHPLLDNAADLHALEAEKTARCAAADAAEQTALSHLENALCFVSETFGAGQELLIFCTQLPSLPGAPALVRRSALYKQLLSTVLPD